MGCGIQGARAASGRGSLELLSARQIAAQLYDEWQHSLSVLAHAVHRWMGYHLVFVALVQI